MDDAARARATPLDVQLCFALYTASRAMTAYYRSTFDDMGITYPQFLVLVLLWERGSAPVTQLGHALQLQTATLSPLLRRMEAAGLVTRTPGTDDERVVEIALTPQGQALEAEAAALQRRAGEATQMSMQEIGELRTTLTQLAARMRAATGDGAL